MNISFVTIGFCYFMIFINTGYLYWCKFFFGLFLFFYIFIDHPLIIIFFFTFLVFLYFLFYIFNMDIFWFEAYCELVLFLFIMIFFWHIILWVFFWYVYICNFFIFYCWLCVLIINSYEVSKRYFFLAYSFFFVFISWFLLFFFFLLSLFMDGWFCYYSNYFKLAIFRTSNFIFDFSVKALVIKFERGWVLIMISGWFFVLILLLIIYLTTFFFECLFDKSNNYIHKLLVFLFFLYLVFLMLVFVELLTITHGGLVFKLLMGKNMFNLLCGVNL